MNMFSKARSRVAGCVNDLLRLGGIEVKVCSLLPQHNLLGLRNVPFKTILDVGANEGQFVSEFRPFFQNATFYSFEPLLSCFKVIKQLSLKDNQWQCFNIALGSENKQIDFYAHTDHLSSSSVLPAAKNSTILYPETKAQQVVTVDCMTLDSWVESNPGVLNAPVLLKMDVQGYESWVLQGAKHALSKIDAVITEIIVDKLYEQQSTFDEQVVLLAEAGLNFSGVLRHAFDSKCNVISLDCVFRRPYENCTLKAAS